MIWVWTCIIFFTVVTCFCVLAVGNLIEEAKTHEMEIKHPILWAVVAAIVGVFSFSMMLGYCLVGFLMILKQ